MCSKTKALFRCTIRQHSNLQKKRIDPPIIFQFKFNNLKAIFPFLSGNMSSSMIGSLIVITQPNCNKNQSEKKKNERFAFDYVTMPHRKPISYLAGMLPSLSNKMIICSSAGCDNTAQRFVLIIARPVKIGLICPILWIGEILSTKNQNNIVIFWIFQS